MHSSWLCCAERSRTTELVNVFYDLVTDLYEWGWGQVSNILNHPVQFLPSYQFPQHVKESFEAGLKGLPTLSALN